MSTAEARSVLVSCPPMAGLLPDLENELARNRLRAELRLGPQVLSEAELVELLPRFDGWIAGDDPATRVTLAAGRAGRLRALVKWGVGVDNVDFAAARELGLPVRNTPAMFGNEVADLAMAYVVALAREILPIDRGVRAGAWPKPAGISLAGRTAAVVGFGDIGRSFSRRAIAAEMRVLAFDPVVSPSGELAGVAASTWPERLEEADFLVLCCALTAANRHLLNGESLSRLKPGVRIVNVARGPLIDERALEAALASGQVHSAALDVFEVEPLPLESPLRTHARCLFGSHNASNTRDAALRASLRAIELLSGLLDER